VAQCRVSYCEAPLCFEGLTKRRTSCLLWLWLLCWTVISELSISSSNQQSEIETACFVVWRQAIGSSKTICIHARDNTVSKLNNTTNWILTRHAMYVYCNIEARLCNHCLRGKSNKVNIFWVCVCSLRYPAWNAFVLCFIVICALSFDIIS